MQASPAMRLADFRPAAQVRVAATTVERASTPAVDVHNHLGRWLAAWVGREGGWTVPDVGELLALMDRCGVEAMVNLDGRWGRELDENLERYDRAHPGRFHTFCHVDWADALADARGGERQATAVARARAAGAVGLKVWKDLGLWVEDPSGRRVLPDDERLRAIWQAAGEAGLPVLIHTADPVAFWEPVDGRNERYEELQAHPEWSFAGGGYPSFARLLEALEAVVAAHPGTTFIAAHAGCHAEDLGHVARLLDTYPNLCVDLSARLPELGRQPRATRRLVLRHPDRVLFGTDVFPPDERAYRLWYRFLESDDEAFAYQLDPEAPPPTGRWAVSALDLPPDVLALVYRQNARRVLGLAAAA